MSLHHSMSFFSVMQRTPAEEITFETLKNAIGMSTVSHIDWHHINILLYKLRCCNGDHPEAWLNLICCSLPPSSGQCGYGGAGEGAEETSGGEVSKSSLWGNCCSLRSEGTSKMQTYLFFNCCSNCFCRILMWFIMSCVGHSTAEQTKSDLWDYNQVRDGFCVVSNKIKLYLFIRFREGQ